MASLCQLCAEPLPPGETESDLVSKFTAQLRNDQDRGNKLEEDELQRLSASLVCVQCVGCLEGAVAKRREVNAVEAQMRKLQMEVVKLMQSLKRLLADYVDELKAVRGRMGGGEEDVELEDPVGQTLKMQVILAIAHLSEFREDLTRKTVFENPTVPDSPPPHASPMEWDDAEVRAPEREEGQQDTEEQEDERLPSRKVGKRVSSKTTTAKRKRLKPARVTVPKKVKKEVIDKADEIANPDLPQPTFPPKYKPSWLTPQRKKAGGVSIKRKFLTCQTCPNFSTRHQYAFEGHLHQHEQQLTTTSSETTEPRPCPHCSLSFLHPQMWEWHVYSHEGHVRNRCDLCAKMLPCFSMASHLHQDHEVERVISCPSCSCVTSTPDKYLEHLRLHKNVGDSQACYLCPSRFGKRKLLLQHLHDAHQALSKLPCSEPGCPQEFLEVLSLRSHEACHKASFACFDCNKAFGHKYNYQAHMESVHQGKRWTCAQCGVQLKSEKGLKCHEKRHEITGQPWQCPHCPKKFKQETTLRLHQRLHEGQGMVCDQCGAAFSTAHNLKSHVMYNHRVMEEDEKVQCDLCGARFKTKQALKRHMNVHADVRRWECEMCQKKFRTNHDLINHRRTHTGERPYGCGECGKQFAHPATLHNHRRIVHKIEVNTRKRT